MNQSARFTLLGAVVLALGAFGCGTSSSGGSSIHPGEGSGNASNSGGGDSQASGGSSNSSMAGGLHVNAGGMTSGDTGGSGGQDGKSCDGKLVGYIRDFLATNSQDFEPWTVTGPAGPTGSGFPNRYMPLKVDPAVGAPNAQCPNGRPCIETGIVQNTLDADLKPIYNKKDDGSDSLTTTGKDNFHTWFHDTANVNLGMNLPLQFTLDPTDPTGKTYVFDSRTMMGGGFFPIDGQLLGPTATPPNEGQDPDHNFSFTFELHTKFTYSKGQVFNFQGDDDVWVFIDGKLVVDLGGIHDIGTQNVSLDSLNLMENMSYTLDFFYAERHCCASNFVLSTSIAFTDCDIMVIK